MFLEADSYFIYYVWRTLISYATRGESLYIIFFEVDIYYFPRDGPIYFLCSARRILIYYFSRGGPLDFLCSTRRTSLFLMSQGGSLFIMFREATSLFLMLSEPDPYFLRSTRWILISYGPRDGSFISLEPLHSFSFSV